jgi:hypothetical protein
VTGVDGLVVPVPLRQRAIGADAVVREAIAGGRQVGGERLAGDSRPVDVVAGGGNGRREAQLAVAALDGTLSRPVIPAGSARAEKKVASGRYSSSLKISIS